MSKSQFPKIDPYDWFCAPGSHIEILQYTVCKQCIAYFSVYMALSTDAPEVISIFSHYLIRPRVSLSFQTNMSEFDLVVALVDFSQITYICLHKQNHTH